MNTCLKKKKKKKKVVVLSCQKRNKYHLKIINIAIKIIIKTSKYLIRIQHVLLLVEYLGSYHAKHQGNQDILCFVLFLFFIFCFLFFIFYFLFFIFCFLFFVFCF